MPLLGTMFTGTFTTARVIGKAKLEGEWMLNQLVIRPDASLFLSSETAAGYTVRDAMGNPVAIAGFTTKTLDLSGGARIERPVTLQSGLEFIPQVGFRLGISGSGANLALGDPHGSALIGFELAGDHWRFATSVEAALWASSLKTATWKGSFSGRF